MRENLPDNYIDMTICSPPYNIDLGNNKYRKEGYDIYDDDRDYGEYLEWLEEVFREVYRVTKKGGRVGINVGDQHNGQVPLHSDVIQFMVHKLGWLMRTTLVWNKKGTSNRCSWGSYGSPSNPSFPKPYEFILIFSKETMKKESEGRKITVKKDEFIRNSYGLWEFPTERGQDKFDHPATFPLELPKRLIQQLSYRGDIIFDPFGGVGTTALAAKQLGRKYILTEISEKYCEEAEKRLRVNYLFDKI